MKEDSLNPQDKKAPVDDKGLSYKYEYHVSGMHCPACELLVEKKIEKLEIIKNVNAVLSDKKVYLETGAEISSDELLAQVNELIKFRKFLACFKTS